MKFKKPTSLFKCWLRNRNFTENTLDTRYQIKSPMWPHKFGNFRGGKLYRRFTPQIAKYDLPQIICTIYPPSEIAREDLPLKLPSTIYPPPNHPILSKISDTQHHALLHKGLFCERPTKWSEAGFDKGTLGGFSSFEYTCKSPFSSPVVVVISRFTARTFAY